MIPARYSASRFPGKLMKDLGGMTVIARTYQATLNTGLFDAVYVVTDSADIFNDIQSIGGHVIMSQKECEEEEEGKRATREGGEEKEPQTWGFCDNRVQNLTCFASVLWRCKADI